MIDSLAKQYGSMDTDKRSSLLVMNSQVLGVLVASMAGGDEKDMQIGASVAGNATQYNYLSHRELDAFEEQARNCKAQGNCEQIQEEFRRLSVALDDELNQLCSTNSQSCLALHGGFIEQRLSIQERMAELSLDSSIPWQLRADLHAYQLQNMSAVGTLTQAANQLSLENFGLSSDQADLAAKLAATLASGGVLSKGATGKDAASNVALFERQRAGYAAREIKNAQPVGSALKDDPMHRAPSYVVDQIPEKGRLFTIRGADKRSYNLTQMEGAVNDKIGVFEWLVNSKGELTHQRFIPGGKITGTPNQIPSRLPR